jgi:hypothetical protein
VRRSSRLGCALLRFGDRVGKKELGAACAGQGGSPSLLGVRWPRRRAGSVSAASGGSALHAAGLRRPPLHQKAEQEPGSRAEQREAARHAAPRLHVRSMLHTPPARRRSHGACARRRPPSHAQRRGRQRARGSALRRTPPWPQRQPGIPKTSPKLLSLQITRGRTSAPAVRGESASRQAFMLARR